MRKIAYDTHIHSCYSTDSDTPVREQIEQAIRLGLHGICLTDHMDYEYPAEFSESSESAPFLFDTEIYIHELNQLKTLYPSLTIQIGVECGMQLSKRVLEKNRKLAKDNPWDYIIGSLHLVEKEDPYFPSYWEGKSADSCVRRYFEQLYENILSFHEFDSLGHLDYIVRYAPDSYDYNPASFFDIIDEILRFLICNGKALEINTSGLKSAGRSQNPHLEILKRYASLGGELVTIGSDAHTPEHLAFSFAQVPALMEEAGLHQYITYQKHNPVFHTL